MASLKFVLILSVFLVGFEEILGHGSLMDPVSRSSAWRKGFKTPVNYNDNELFCGGGAMGYGRKCGACGDNVNIPPPRPNENGGTYGVGTIVKKYTRGQRTTVTVNLSANHQGYFQFAICPLRPGQSETEECFAQHPVKLANGSDKYRVTSSGGDHHVDVVLPQGLTCDHCSFRWHYQAGNNWGICSDGSGRVGCGPQEWFRGCADISIQ